MKRHSLSTLPAALACLAMAFPPNAFAAHSPVARDIALRDGGVLVGQVVDPQGVAKAGTPVSIRYGQHEVVRTTTDANGVFAARGLRGGQYELVTEDGASLCRLWTPGTEPPAAEPAALVVSGDQVVRGVPGSGPIQSCVQWMQCHPYITAGVIATAIAVPILLADDDDSGS